MEFEDFKRNYDKVEICNMTPDSLTDNTKRHWEVSMFEGNWIRGSTAGGCRNYVGETIRSDGDLRMKHFNNKHGVKVYFDIFFPQKYVNIFLHFTADRVWFTVYISNYRIN